MRKIVNYILILLPLLGCLAACNDNDRESLDLSQDVSIHDFVVDGISGTIDHSGMTIKIMLPPFTDLTRLKPVVTTAEGATVLPASGEITDFTAPVEYKVINGNLYNKYKVTAEVIKAKITRFLLDDQYAGIIDQTANKITVAVPTSTDITRMVPTIEHTEGAVLSPEAGKPYDFTEPVTFTLTYMNERFSYEVSVQKRDEAYAFLGTALTADELANADDKEAALWMMNNVPNSRYISFEQIKDGSIALSDFDVIWFHYDDEQSLPGIAVNRNVVTALKNYYEGGGNIILSGFACLYVSDLGITSYIPNNTFGNSGTAEPMFGLHELWGISITGCEDHPLYKDLNIDRTSGWPVVYFLGYDVSRRNNGCIWNLEAPPFQIGWDNWKAMTGGNPLASFNWDDNCDQRVNIAEFPGVNGGKGTAICIGAPSYDWYSEGNEASENSYRYNIEKLTLNAFEYLTE